MFGHCWVALAVLVRVPFSHRSWALPVLFRLYRNIKDCERRRVRHRKKTELAREMLDLIVQWSEGRRVEVAADGAYCNDTLARGVPDNIVFFGSMRPDAVLTSPPAPGERAGGRPRKRGAVLRKPEKLARDGRTAWSVGHAVLYGKLTRVRYKTIDAQWYRAMGTRLLRVVVVECTSGQLPMRAFFSSSDPTLSIERILEILRRPLGHRGLLPCRQATPWLRRLAGEDRSCCPSNGAAHRPPLLDLGALVR